MGALPIYRNPGMLLCLVTLHGDNMLQRYGFSACLLNAVAPKSLTGASSTLMNLSLCELSVDSSATLPKQSHDTRNRDAF